MRMSRHDILTPKGPFTSVNFTVAIDLDYLPAVIPVRCLLSELPPSPPPIALQRKSRRVLTL